LLSGRKRDFNQPHNEYNERNNDLTVLLFAEWYRNERSICQDADSLGRDDLLHLACAAEKSFDHINSQLQDEDEWFNQPRRFGGRLSQTNHPSKSFRHRKPVANGCFGRLAGPCLSSA
jgi:hypothetical protein